MNKAALLTLNFQIEQVRDSVETSEEWSFISFIMYIMHYHARLLFGLDCLSMPTRMNTF